MGHSKQKKINQEKPSLKDVMVDILDDFKTTVLNMFKEQKKNVDKDKKTMCEQNGNINKETDT